MIGPARREDAYPIVRSDCHLPRSRAHSFAKNANEWGTLIVSGTRHWRKIPYSRALSIPYWMTSLMPDSPSFSVMRGKDVRELPTSVLPEGFDLFLAHRQHGPSLLRLLFQRAAWPASGFWGFVFWRWCIGLLVLVS